ncbi:MAG: carbohydrate ABC transporter permease [Candidatus Gallimonas sp.]
MKKKDGDKRARKTEGSFVKYYRKHNDAFVAAFILTPMLLWWVIACGFPLLFGIVLGFFEMKGVATAPRFIGLENFITFFSSPSYLRDLWNTVWIGTVSTLLVTICGLAVALLLNAVSRFKGLYRSVWYLPAVTSTVAVTQIIGIFFDPVNGIVNKLLVQSGHDTISLDTNYSLAICAILFFSVWKGAGGSAIVWLAGLQSVDKNQYEAAELDGCNRKQKFFYITLPGLKPIATYIIITGIIGALQIYEPIAFITNGGPLEKTNVLVLRIIQDGFFNFDFGMAGASSLILAIIVVISTLVYFRCSRENVARDEARARKRIAKRGKTNE